ncbi:MAG: biopolymer transporter ExbD [Hyphomicrobiales bacterium]|nr:biopolymer transporter ExbD [Hyphomicrobiales bacterium]
MGARLDVSAGGRKRRRRHEPIAEINVTPFVDVMLVLLIIFMVSAPLLTSGVPIELPDSSASPAPIPSDANPLSITVDPDGRIYLQDRELSLDEIGAKLSVIAKLRGQDPVYLRGDSGANYGQLMQVMGQINAAGFERILLVSNVREAN